MEWQAESNAGIEAFFSSLRTEWTARKTYRTRDQARADVVDSNERFYSLAPQALDPSFFATGLMRRVGHRSGPNETLTPVMPISDFVNRGGSHMLTRAVVSNFRKLRGMPDLLMRLPRAILVDLPA